MGRRSIRVTGPDGKKKRVVRGGVYIPGFVKRMQMESRLGEAPAKVRRSFPERLRETSQELSSTSDSEPGSLIGGISSSGIHAYTQVSTISNREMSDEERRKKWQPPVRDTSRFKGSSASRHRAASSHRDPSGNPGGDFAANDEMPPARKKAEGSSKRAKKRKKRR